VGIFDDVTGGLAQALKARDEVRLATLRSIRAAFLNEMKKDNAASLTDEVCVTLLRRLQKQRQESIDAFSAAGRSDRADAERAELAIIDSLLPKLADEATTRAWVEEAIAASGASGAKDLGKVMGAVMKAHKGDVDGNLARRIAAERLG
jgi:hypothetical protein